MQITTILLLSLIAGSPVAASSAQQPRPETALQLVRGQLALGPYVLGMTVAEAESRHDRALVLEPNVDDTGQCEGLDAVVTFNGHRLVLTFTKDADGLRLRNIFVRFPQARDLDEIAAEVSRRVPALRIAEHDPGIKGNKSAWALPSDPLQTVLIGVREGLWVSRGCLNGE